MKNIFVGLALLIVCVGSVDGLTCYFCANCPVPFYPAAGSVTQAYSNTGYCAKKSRSSTPGALAARGPAEPGLCSWSGCKWTTDIFGAYVYACCCRNNLCNTGSITSKSTIAVLLGALALSIFNRYM